LRLQDLAQAIPGILVAVLLPGYALATLMAPRWRAWERLAASPGLSAGFLGVLGLSLRLVHIPFEPLTVFLCIAALAAGAVARRRLSGANAADDVSRWLPLPALIAGAVGAAVLAVALAGQVLPPDWDPAVHGATANGIASTHDVLPVVQVPLEGTYFARLRPGFEAMSAVVSWVGGPPPALSMTPAITAVVLLMPLGLTLLALEATGSIALAAVVPLVAVGLAFPSFQVILGRFPQVVDSTLVVPLVVAALRLLRSPQVRDNALLLGGLAASVWVIHGLEAFTALVVGGVLLATAAVAAWRASPRETVVRVGSGAVAALAGAGLVTVLTRLPKPPPPLHPERFGPLGVPASSPVHPHSLIELVTQTDLTSPVAVALIAAGVVALLVTRRMLWVLASEVIVLLAMADALSWRHLARFWIHGLNPWGDLDRLVGVQYWLIPLLLGAGLLAVARGLRDLSRRPGLRIAVPVAAAAAAIVVLLAHNPIARAWRSLFGLTVDVPPLGSFKALADLWSWSAAIIAAAAAVALAWLALVRDVRLPSRIRRMAGAHWPDGSAAWAALGVLAVICTVAGAGADLTVYQRAVVERGLSTPADLTVINRMWAILPPGALVLTDSNYDAGKWVAALTDLTPLTPNQFEGGSLGYPLVLAIANACTDPATAEQALTQADAVFVGGHHLLNAPFQWNQQCIARLPGVRLIATAQWEGTTSAAFAVVHARS
jgi:hypothetical protein